MPDVEWLILGDAAQVVGNKLYVMGGGWDVLTINTGFPVQYRIGIALSLRVAWNETNQKHNLEVELRSEDGQSLFKIQGQFEAGRPAGIKPGQDQRVQFAADVAPTFVKGGTYVLAAKIENQEIKSTYFNVVSGPALLIRGQPEAGQAA